MSYKNLWACVRDLERHGELIRIQKAVDPDLEMAEIHRRVQEAEGPAILYENVKGSPFQAVSNIYGTKERTEFIFRHTLKKVQRVIELKADPSRIFQRPMKYLGAPFTALSALPMQSWFNVPSRRHQTSLDLLPQIKCWPKDGGAFITLPQVLTFPPEKQNLMSSNLGMYRIQLSGNEYTSDEVGMHYQLHRGIGVHQRMHKEAGTSFRASIFVGGPPAHTFAAIMPLPEGLSELTFAGMLNGRRFRYKKQDGYVLSSDADFVITGEILTDVKKPEGPFGDHLGYYSLKHDFPVMKVDGVYHRSNPLWHFTVVGRPPAEDTNFGWLIHQLVSELATEEFPGLKEVHAVDAAGVHPLLLAIGSERYMPFREQRPEEVLTIANHLLGKGQTSLAKFLIIANQYDDPNLDTHDIRRFFRHILKRVEWNRDLHFQTKTTIDTLDYSGTGWNAGSKVVIAAVGKPIRELETEIPTDLTLPDGFSNPLFYDKGILTIQSPKFIDYETAQNEVDTLLRHLKKYAWTGIPLIILTEDSRFITETENNFLWVTFTRTNPSHDIYGMNAKVEFKHWGCDEPLVLDARIKPHHAPVLETDPQVEKQVDQLFTEGGPLDGVDA